MNDKTSWRIGVLRGDGIGPEIVESVVKILDAAAKQDGCVRFDWVELPMGWQAIKDHGHPMPESTIAALALCDAWIMGPHDSASYPPEMKQLRNPSGELRHHFDLYANIRPAATHPRIRSTIPSADLVIVRENTEGFYPDRNMYAGLGEWMPTPDVAIVTGVFTRRAAERIAHVACRLAQRRRKHLSIVHKANVIKLGTGLFLDTCRRVAEGYPDVSVDDYHIDAMTAHLVRRAADFDVIVTTNMFGDILSDLTAELTGSLGLAPSINQGDDHAMAQAAHGAAPDIAGQGIANPIGEIQSTTMLCDWLAARHSDLHLAGLARRVENAVARTLADGVATRDIGGSATTEVFTRRVIDRLE